ncbi:MAG: cation-efflux pump [Thermoguttaceae bacterium]|nr:cation-efflux pump [Thermoguttaceae bacterium]MDW8038082.1 cation diffusion facilitator family transporter [Thermoguttaceae bacterium]
MDHAGRNVGVWEGEGEKFWVAISSLVAAVFLTAFKLVVGLWTNSLGILSEAAHSALDLMAAAMTVWAVRLASRPADSRHTYGHEKVENLSALLQTLLLLATCGWIMYEAVERLAAAEPPEVKANVWAFLVVLTSIGVDWSRSRALRRAAQKHQSQALEADALHFSTDIFSSLVVLVGLVAVAAAQRGGPTWLLRSDAVAAMIVAVLVVVLSLRLAQKAIEELLDTIPGHLQAQLKAALQQVPGLAEVDQVRVRRSGSKVFADLTVRILPTSTLEQSHRLAHQAEQAVRQLLPGADVVVHVEPLSPAQADLVGTVRSVAGRHGLAAHAIQLVEHAGQQTLQLHLEVPAHLSLEQAHGQATACENELQAVLPGIGRIVSHLEPTASSQPTQALPVSWEKSKLFVLIQQIAQSCQPQASVHDLQLLESQEGVSLAFHCTLPGQTSIAQAHDLAEMIEKHLRAALPRLSQVTIHVEPEESQKPDSSPTDHP